MAIKFNHSITPSPAPISIPAPIPISTTIAVPSLLSHTPLVDRISFHPLITSTTTSPIMLVDAPLYAHCLHIDSPTPEELHNMTACLCDPCLAIPFNSYLDINFPLWALYWANFQNKCLGNLLALAATK